MIGLRFPPQLRDTETPFLFYLAAFHVFPSYLMASKIIEVKVVGYVFAGICLLPCLTEVDVYCTKIVLAVFFLKNLSLNNC